MFLRAKHVESFDFQSVVIVTIDICFTGNEDFINLFKWFGDTFLFNSELFPMVEKSVCKLYALKTKNVNEGRYSKFLMVHLNGRKKTPEPQQLPPTADALLYH